MSDLHRQCHKVRFPTKQHDDDALLQARIKRALKASTRRRETRSYRCPQCQAWHLTSKPYRPGNAP